jgi:branched-chain amino acid transport system ATP-binding protein
MTLLDVCDITVAYGATVALRSVSLTVAEGEIVAVLGGNGAGKTSLLRAISGMTPLRSGSIAFGNSKISGLAPDAVVSRGIAHVPEGRRMFAGLTTEMNLRLGMYSRPDRLSAEKELAAAIERWPILKRRRFAAAGTLSGGEQQLVALMRGILAAPRLLLLDEPSMGLSPALVKEIYSAIAALAAERNLAVLLVEQNVHRALELAQRAYVLVSGAVRYAGASDELTESTLADLYLTAGAA